MDAEAAKARATTALREIDSPEPLALIKHPPTEYEWCWTFTFNTVKAIETGSFSDALMTGPLVVPKSGAEVWVAPSSPPVERWLDQYAEEQGLPRVPVPEPEDPFS
jgi:hypothetical protein